MSFIGAFEDAIVHYAKRGSVAGVICGHIHSPVIRQINGIAYYNSGDWVESMSALVEDFSGKIQLVTNFGVGLEPKAVAMMPKDIVDDAEAGAWK